jgi:protein SCO1/2
MKPRLSRRDAVTLGALSFIIVVTAAWWALALWPVPGEVPAWLAATRTVCFGTVANGLPGPTGWLVLIGEPVAMGIALMIIAGEALPSALRVVVAHRPGRAALGASGVLILGGLVLAGVRVARATSLDFPAAVDDEAAVERLGSAPPSLSLVDQRGERITLGRFRGRTVIVTFAYGHCSTVCPIVIHELNRARALLERPPVVLVVTLDPWRDTPSRLASIAERWALGPDGFVLGGTVGETETTLDRWNVPRTRDPLSGEVTHGTPVFLVAPDGSLAWRLTPSAESIARLVRELQP